jgi:hypothetical protein
MSEFFDLRLETWNLQFVRDESRADPFSGEPDKPEKPNKPDKPVFLEDMSQEQT